MIAQMSHADGPVRSAMQLTLMRLTKKGLADVVTEASSGQSATPYSAISAVRDGKAVVVVLFATQDGKTKTVNVNL
jgi:hypothetical protein